MIILSFLSTISAVFSIDEDFVALAQNSSITACRCTIIENTIKIGNTGDINSLYSIKQEGSASAWSIIAPKSFSLDEKKMKTLTNPINIPCTAGAGEYGLSTYITTGFGLKKVITQNIIIEKCEVKEKPVETIINTTETEEKTEEIDNTVKTEETVEEANKTVKTEETSETNKTSTKEESQWGNIEVIVPEIAKMCGCENKTYTITIKSKDPETVKTTIQGPSWTKLGWNSAKDMGTDDEFSLDLMIEPDCNDTGTKTIKILTESLNNTENKKETTVEFNFNTKEGCDKESTLRLANILKWTIYIVGGFVLILVILLIVLYSKRSDEEPSTKKRAVTRKVNKLSKNASKKGKKRKR
jgi:hypothetical protein